MYPWNQQGLQFYNASAVGHLAKDLDCAILRIPILPNDLATQTTLVETVVDACIANGIYAIINWHGSTAAQRSVNLLHHNGPALWDESQRHVRGLERTVGRDLGHHQNLS